MKNKKNINENKDNNYGEYICSYFGWIPISKQKDRAEELDKMTKKGKKKKK